MPVSEPPLIVKGPPVTLVSEMPLVPAVEVTVLTVEFPSATPLRSSAVLPELIELLFPVMVNVPPPMALIPCPVVVVTLRLPPVKLIADPGLLVRTIALAAPVVKLLVPPLKVTEPPVLLVTMMAFDPAVEVRLPENVTELPVSALTDTSVPVFVVIEPA